MAFVTLDYDVHELAAAFADMAVSAQRATVNALNVVGRRANTEVAKYIKQNYNIKQSSLKQGRLVNIKRADARKSRPVFTITIKKQGRGLMKYGPRETDTGVSVLIKKSRKHIKSSFITAWKKGKGRPAFGRGGGAAFRPWVFVVDKRLGKVQTQLGMRYKRRALFGPAVWALYTSLRSRQIFRQTIKDLYDPILNEKFVNEYEKMR